MGNLSEEQNELNSLKQALAAVKKARARLDVIEKSQREPIAIIGMSCRFPGAANSPEAFWRLLETGTDAISQVPADRWNSADLYDSDPAMPGKMNSRWGGFIDQIDQFDANFFGISPREATQMDPQQRLVLEIAWEAIENSGLTKDELAGSKTGVYIGVHSHSADYTLRQYSDPSAIDIYTGTGTAHNVIAGRLAYLFDLRGPSMTVDTACSSSLVAVHLACQSLRSNESQMALVAGVNLMLSPEFTIAASKMHMLAPDGRCKAFDAQANGFVRGEGCGVIVLKRLSDALAHGDNIIALIRGSALNQDGRTNGLTAPNGLSQQQVVRQALENAAVGPSEIGFVEAHGTGTSLGDVIELDALGTIFDRENRNGKPCFLGSAKTNIGHLEGAAGIAGLIKAVLSLQKRMIPPLVHFKNLNPNISLKNTSLVVPSTLQPWQEARKRFAAVSSFGWSGTNAHVVLEEAPPADSKFSSASTNPYLLPLSAHAPEALRDLARSYSSFLTQASPSDLADVCYTASCRRTHHANRLALVGASSDELINKISAFLQENLPVEISRIDDQAKIVFVFPGQGSQWLGMGRELLKQNQVFRETLQRCEQAIQPWVDWSLTEQLGLDEDSPNYRLNEISVIQPILFAFEIALSAVWRSWGIEPHAVIGHSMGEVAAAYIAGALRLEDAAHVICRRSQLMQRTSGRGGMAVVGISIVEANQLIQGLEDRISVAVNNSPRSTVLSGDPQALEEIMEELARRDIFCRRVRVDVASHSPQMDPLRAELVEALRDIKPQAAHIPFFSTVTEEVSHGATLNAEYWGRNLRQPVQFGSMIQKLLDADHSVFIEMSPHPILLTSIQEVSIELNKSSTEVASLRRDQPELTSLLGELGLLYRLGYPIDWKKLYPTGGRVVSLPAYPWQHESFWLEVEASTNSFARTIAGDKQSQHAVLGQEIELAVQNGQRTWEFELSPRKFPFMYDHKLQGLAILAASNFLEMALAATEVEFGDSPAMLTEIEFQHPLVLPSENRSIPFQFHLVKLEEEDGWAFQVFSRRNQAWTRHIVGRAVPSADTPKEHPIRLEDLRSRCVNQIQREAFYTWLENNHIAIGRNIQNVTKVGYSPGEVLGLLEINEGAEQSTDIHRLRLAVLDGCFQLSAAATPEFA
ncbi:MAG: type I polyketide synthase, partial [Anaerolineales bacterium]